MPDFVKFLLSWSCPIANLEGREFNDRVTSPVFRTTHKGIAFEWRIRVYPKGVGVLTNNPASPEKEYRDHIGLFCHLDNGFCKVEVGSQINCFIDVSGKRRNIKIDKKLSEIDMDAVLGMERKDNDYKFFTRFLDSRDTMIAGSPDFLINDGSTLKPEGPFVVDGKLTVCCILRILESSFEYGQIMKKLEEEQEDANPPAGDFLKDCYKGIHVSI